MSEPIDEKSLAERCLNEQREFFALVSKAIMAAASVTEVDNRLSSAIREMREEHAEFQKTLTPVLKAYEKGLTLKSKLGTIAMIYIAIMFLFPNLSPNAIFSLIKVLL